MDCPILLTKSPHKDKIHVFKGLGNEYRIADCQAAVEWPGS